MQMPLPLFPSSTKLINSNIGVFEKDDIVYLLNDTKDKYPGTQLTMLYEIAT